MKLILWFSCALLALVWTGLIALAVQLSEWALASIASGQVVGVVEAAGARLPPGWLQAFFDPALLQGLVDVVSGVLRWLGGVLPGAGALSGWVSIALWTAWGAGLVALLGVSALLHWGLGLWSRHAMRASPS